MLPACVCRKPRAPPAALSGDLRCDTSNCRTRHQGRAVPTLSLLLAAVVVCFAGFWGCHSFDLSFPLEHLSSHWGGRGPEAPEVPEAAAAVLGSGEVGGELMGHKFGTAASRHGSSPGSAGLMREGALAAVKAQKRGKK